MQKHVTQQQKNSQTGTFCILAGRGVLVWDFFFSFDFGFFCIYLSSELFKVGFIISMLK